MALTISASNLLTNHSLTLRPDGVIYNETSFVGGRRKFRFDQIECILLSPDHKLSFQVGKEVFSIPTQPKNEKHRTVIETLVKEVRRAWQSEATAP